MWITIFLFVVSAQTVSYYVSVNGSDDSKCGEKDFPCASINQVLINHPGESCDVLLEAGEYATNSIVLESDAKVIFKGAGAENTKVITKTWDSTTFITNTPSSGFEFHELSLVISLLGTASFTRTGNKDNAVGFYDVVVNCSAYVNLVGTTGGSVVLDNVSFSNTVFSYVVLKNNPDEGTDTSVEIINSIFINVRNGFGGLIYLTGPGVSNVIVDNSSFLNVQATVNFITINVADAGSRVSVTNSVFNGTEAFGPCVRVGLSEYESVTVVHNVTFCNASATDYFSGGLAINGSGVDQSVTLNTLKFVSCVGPYAGALYVASVSLNLSQSSFAADEGNYANDVLHAYLSTSPFKYSIADSCSSSEVIKAAIFVKDTNTLEDISDTLPNPSSSADGKPGKNGSKERK